MSKPKYVQFNRVPWEQDPRLCNKRIQIGTTVIVHGLKKRPELNEKRAVIFAKVETKTAGEQGCEMKMETRWRVKLLFYDKPLAVKTDNLKLPKQGYDDHPEYLALVAWKKKHRSPEKIKHVVSGKLERVEARGVTYPTDPVEDQTRKLVELLVCGNKDLGYSANQTILCGTALQHHGSITESMWHFGLQRIEHAVAIRAMMMMCQYESMECSLYEDKKTPRYEGTVECVMAALLEGYPTSISAIFQMIACTPYIGPHYEMPEMFQNMPHKNVWGQSYPNYDYKTWKITPPQTHKDYITCMENCYFLLGFIAEVAKGTDLLKVFFRTIEKHDLFPQFIQKSLNLFGREVLGTPDGEAVGPSVRTILSEMANIDGTMDQNLYDMFTTVKDFPKDPTPLRALLTADKDITNYEELRGFLHSLVYKQNKLSFLKP